MAAITHDGYVIGASPTNASSISYDSTISGLAATNVQSAIDELAASEGGGRADDVSYSNSVTGLAATNVQEAIDEVHFEIPNDFSGTTAQWNALTTEQKKSYDRAIITDDYDEPASIEANVVSYNNAVSGLASLNVQDAIDELVSSESNFIGTTSQWSSLPTETKKSYDLAILTDD